MNRLLISKGHRNDLVSLRLQFWKRLANVKESFTQREEYNFRTGTKIFANNLASSCWEESILTTPQNQVSTFDVWTIVLSSLVFELGCGHFQEKLHLLHPVLKFTIEKEQNNSLNFLDVLVEKEGTGFLTSIYRKPTFTGQCIRWNRPYSQ